jgi:hypothetical protein
MPAGSSCTEKAVASAAHAAPQGDADQAHAQHRDQLAHEHRVQRHRRGEHLDHLVRFLLNEVRQQHGRQQQCHEEDDELPEPGDAGADLPQIARRFAGDLALHRHRAVIRRARGQRRAALRLLDDERDSALDGLVDPLRPVQNRLVERAGKHRGIARLVLGDQRPGLRPDIVGRLHDRQPGKGSLLVRDAR